MRKKSFRVAFPRFGDIYIDYGWENDLIKFRFLKAFRVGYENKGSDAYANSQPTEVGQFLYFGFFSVEWKPKGWCFYDHPF